jgi:SNF2 family DNA or RNA helicase
MYICLKCTCTQHLKARRNALAAAESGVSVLYIDAERSHSSDNDANKGLLNSSNAIPKSPPTCLIICPASVRANWKIELLKWGHFSVQILEKSNLSVIDMARKGSIEIVLSSYGFASKHCEDLAEVIFYIHVCMFMSMQIFVCIHVYTYIYVCTYIHLAGNGKY